MTWKAQIGANFTCVVIWNLENYYPKDLTTDAIPPGPFYTLNLQFHQGIH